MKEIAVTIRTIQLSDVEACMQLSTAEGWNQTKKDWIFLIGNPQNICLVAEVHNKVTSTAIAVNYANEVAWIAMVLVDKNYRGRGVSKMLLENILRELKSFKSIKLDATAAGREVYKKFGFKDECLITRMTCLSIKNFSFTNDKVCSVEPILNKDINAIAELDEAVFGSKRTRLIEYLVKENAHPAWQLKSNNNVVAFALGREGNKYHHIGPVIAETMEAAQIIIAKALQELNNKPVVVDALNNKTELINWLQSLGFNKQREFVRMYKNENRLRELSDKYFLICGPEFG